MSIWKKLTYFVPSIRRAAERDIREELESLEEIGGRRELGNLTIAAEDARGELTWMSLERLGEDLRYALRSMRRDKLFALLAVVSTPGQNLTIPPVENLTVRRGDEPQFVATS